MIKTNQYGKNSSSVKTFNKLTCQFTYADHIAYACTNIHLYTLL